MVVFPNAKINLGLNVRYKRNDGFHELETIMLPVALYDILEILPSKKMAFFESGIALDNASIADNLVYKAWALLRDQFDIPPVNIHLHKKIPAGAGLGGGSADAAYTIRVLNELFELNLSDFTMEENAAMLGSDCAFFIQNQCALATGRGEKLEPISCNLKGKYLLLVVPDVHISTAEAYRDISPMEPDTPLAEIIAQPFSIWKNKLKNDFEVSLFPKNPGLELIKNKLYAQGAFYAAMSGSGAAIFGLFHEKPEPPSFEGMRLVKSILL